MKYNSRFCSKGPAEKGTRGDVGGLNDIDYIDHYKMVKGRIAETLVQELFLASGYSVFRYGMENTIPGIMKLLNGNETEAANQIRSMPDFVVQKKNGDVFFIEVKFRANEKFSWNDLGKDYPYKYAYIILVSKKHIKCVTVKELEAGEEITQSSENYLGKRKEFDLDKQKIIDFCDLAVKFFQNV